MIESGDNSIAEFTDPRLVSVYDSVNAYEPNSQPDFYSHLAADLGVATIIDLGCGTGLITCQLAQDGYKVIGVEPASAMLDIARRRPYGDKIQWIQGDASQIPQMDADLAIMTGHVAQFFLSNQDWKAALDSLHGAVRPNGYLAFESRNPLVKPWRDWNSDNKSVSNDSVAGEIDTWMEAHGIQDDIVSYSNHYFFKSSGKELVSPGKLRFRTEDELVRSLAEAGFTLKHLYGDWDERPAGPAERELIVLAQRCRQEDSA